MGERDSLLTRWLKLKRQSKHLEQPRTPTDLSKLPSIDSLTSESDVIAFLQPGVPTDLLGAALRKAWRADPAIRDFVGIAESQWDFNEPASIPGFGSLDPIEDAGSVVRLSTLSAVDTPGSPADSPQDLNPHRDGQLNEVWSTGAQRREQAASLQAELRPSAADGHARPSELPPRHGAALPKSV